ncbi:MAG: HAD-IC family P-type ATPase [archaeon]
MDDWHELSIEVVMSKLSTTKSGLNDSEAEKRVKQFGENISAKEEKTSVIKILLRQFKSFIIYILIAAAVISGIIGNHVEFIIITAIVLFIVLLSFFEEYKATREMESLKKLTPKITKVIRNNKEIQINSSELVPGDIIILTRGDLVPADARVIESTNLQVNESALTGESMPITKTEKILSEKTSLAERKNMVYTGGQVINGHGICVIVETGKNTELGKIASMVKDTREELSPLQKRLDKLGKQFSYSVIAICILIIILGLLRGDGLNNLLLLAVAVAVSGIPESLPAVIGVALAIGMKRMAKQNAIIKRLAAVETLGTCTVICTDKTGTLTQNKMVIENIWTYGSEVEVSGNGFQPEGIFLKEKLQINPTENKNISKILEIGILCNNANLKKEEDEEWKIEGESTEGALVVLAKKAGIEKDQMHKDFPRVHEHPFDSDRKCMSSVHLVRNQHIAYAKGAPERILKRSEYYLENGKIKTLTKKIKEEIIEKNEEYASKGYRVIGLAYKEHKGNFDIKNVEKNLIFAGLVSIRDPPEPSALEAIKLCEEAGIKVIMITGDNPLTAKAVAKELNILTEGQQVITGDELDKLTDDQYLEVVDKISVYARVTPKHKLRVIKALQDRGEIVAMTGDGVNDAPALKKADIGVAMGLCGTEVAKEASEMIIKDDNFSTIVYAVKEGRTIYNNIQKFIYYLLPGNFSEVLLILIATIAGLFPPLTPIMILFINLVTSDIPALGLCLEKPDKTIMQQKPRNPKEGILTNYILLKISQVVPIIVLGTIGLYMWTLTVKQADIATAQTVAFVTIILFELFHVFNAKSFNNTIFSKDTFNNKTLFLGYAASIVATLTVLYFEPARRIFGTVPLTINQWIPIIIMSLSVVFFVEIQKIIINSEIEEHKNIDIHPTRR